MKVALQRVQVPIVEGCNLTCHSCSHLSPLFPLRYVDPDTLADDLAAIDRVASAKFVKVLGGEPLLHPRLLDVLAVVRESGITARVWVTTNGRLLSRQPDAFWAAVDEVEVSLYESRVADPEWAQKAVRHNVRLRAKPVSQFRRMFDDIPADHDSTKTFAACRIVHEMHCWTVSNSGVYQCPPAAYLPRLGVSTDDGCSLDDSTRLRAFLLKPPQSDSCDHCFGTSGGSEPHRMLQIQRRKT